ncbi:DNA-protecting protein DprA [Candidatus Poribacteria bacterium]|nr:DNA-protecting protein DprA [Candidatus Poribacteria bacterium]
MSEEDLSAWISLLDSGMSSPVLNRLLAAFDSPERVLGAPDAALVRLAGLNDDQCRRLRDAAGDRLRLARQLEAFHANGMRLEVRGGPGFPSSLETVENPPPAVFIKGTLVPEDRLAIALVGPRLSTPYGQEVARRLATEFAPLMTVVSGLAIGIDSVAHDAVLKAGGRTIGVAACGLDQDYPKGNGPLRERILEAGALVSAFPPLTKSATHHFPARNHTMAGLVLAVLVIEASEQSGALLTAHAAADEGREVFAVPGDITRRNSRGSNALLQQGAGLATCAADVLAALEPRLDHELRELNARRMSLADALAAEAAASEPELPEAEEIVLETIRHSTRSYDQLLEELVPDTMSVGELAGALLKLELKRLIRQMPGKVYMPR